MCNLYRLDAPADLVAAQFHADPGADPWAGGYVTPGRFAPVIVANAKGRREMVPRLWGVPPPTAAMTETRLIAHARNLDSPFWIGTMRHSGLRCLVPVSAFQIWSAEHDPATGKHSAHWFSLPASPLFAFAGIWRDSEVPGFALIMSEPNRLVSAVRPAPMPLILHAEHQEDWLNADARSARALVEPYPSQLMAVRRAGQQPDDQPSIGR